MNLALLRQYARELSGIHLTTLLSDATITQVINEVYAEVWGAEQWPFATTTAPLETTVGVSLYSLPTNARRVLSVRVANSTNARLLEYRAIDNDSWVHSGDGAPTEWARDGGAIELYPTPNVSETLLVRYVFPVEELSGDTDTPEFSPEYHVALAYGAAARLLARENDETGRAASYQQEYGSLVERMRTDYLHSGASSAFQLGSRPARTSRLRSWR